MNQSKVKKALRKKIDHLPEAKQEKIKNLLYKASLSNPSLFEKFVNALARKRDTINQNDEAYKVFQSSPEYSKPYIWERVTPRQP